MAEEIISSFAGIAEETARLASIQLASVPEETTSSFTAPSPASYSYRESFWSADRPQSRIRSTLSSKSGQSGSNYSSVSSSASAAAAHFGSNELHQERPSIHKVIRSSVAEQLASVPEDSTTGSTAPCLPSNSYRESIRSVAWPQWSIRSTLPSLSGQSGSSALSSNNSGCSSGLGSAGATDSRGELTKIAHRMVSDGYTQRMVQAFGDAVDQDRALKNWFVELDVDWVFEIHGSNGFVWHKVLLQYSSLSSHRELIEKWVRALTVIVTSIKEELVAAFQHETSAVAQFGKASNSAMLVFVEAILEVFKVEDLQPMLHMYVCVSNASYEMSTMHTHSLISSETQSIFTEIGASLVREESRLIQAICTTTKEWMPLNHKNYSWSVGMLQGGGVVHKNTRLMVDYIVLLRKTHTSTQKFAQSQNTGKLLSLIQDMINDLKDVLLQKSELCSDPKLRYLFLLNNSYFVEQEVKPGHHRGLVLTPECEKYMDSYLDVSWGHVLSCILESNSLGPPKPRKKTSSLAKFQAAFHRMYQSQKFWKVPDPQLRSLLQETITKRVISGYRDYLKEHPEIEKQVSGGSNSPEIMEEMLGELFEG